MKKKFALTAVAFLSAAVLAACGAAPSSTTDATGNEIGETLKIGYNLELSGAVAAYGNQEKNGADLAVEEINAAGGVDGKKIEVVSKDNKSDNSEAATLSTSLATEDKVSLILGPATSGAVASASPNATKAGVPLLTPSGTQDDLTSKDGKVEDFVFRTTFQDSYQGQVIAQYATENLSSKKAFVYYDASSDYAKGLYKAFKEAYKGEVIEETYQSGDKDFQAALTKVKSKDFDTVVLLGYYTETGLITKQAREIGIENPILGPDGFSDSKFVEAAGAGNATNVFYVAGYSTSVKLSEAKSENFIKAYTDKFGEEPNMFAALAYDSIYMAAEAAKGAKDSKELAANLASLKDFDGVTGQMTIDEDHNPVKSAIMVELENGVQKSATAVEVK
ncbi:branched-chain amino acid transport system substrate-binding protein [Streptococcus henryi]|jgi:branched-chain amino acid transport system substrate-binding protein|uniref:Branched-chain amino acid transport system substrate-binding protein n=1 Tax=Streptococcus henryi TaxID=439219 RepID=A0A1G6CSH1_9STRE|nr:ABC transporter substrate-binding protein [Streptococcus henryi]SDB35802.1 branched-chain amino acid transport system substrate-binding protein [Streptococcus henryi]